MTALSISTAWIETVAFVKREAGLLFPIALGLIALPTAFFQAMAPVAAHPGVEPQPGLWMLFIIPLIVVSVIGQLAIIALALGREVVVGDALGLALRRCLPAVGAALLFGVAATILLIPVLVVSVLLAKAPLATALIVCVVVAVGLFLSVRFLLLSPVAAAEAVGPVGILKRSWELTRGHGWKLLGLIVIVVIVFLVLAFAISAVGGLLIFALVGRPDPGSLAFFLTLLLSTLLNTVFGAFFATLIARIYVQLAGDQVNGT